MMKTVIGLQPHIREFQYTVQKVKNVYWYLRYVCMHIHTLCTEVCNVN